MTISKKIQMIQLTKQSNNPNYKNYNQKLLRMPFYKREELKKKEERKQKNINHYHQHKKKEDTIKIEKKDVCKIAH